MEMIVPAACVLLFLLPTATAIGEVISTRAINKDCFRPSVSEKLDSLKIGLTSLNDRLGQTIEKAKLNCTCDTCDKSKTCVDATLTIIKGKISQNVPKIDAFKNLTDTQCNLGSRLLVCYETSFFLYDFGRREVSKLNITIPSGFRVSGCDMANQIIYYSISMTTVQSFIFKAVVGSSEPETLFAGNGAVNDVVFDNVKNVLYYWFSIGGVMGNINEDGTLSQLLNDTSALNLDFEPPNKLYYAGFDGGFNVNTDTGLEQMLFASFVRCVAVDTDGDRLFLGKNTGVDVTSLNGSDSQNYISSHLFSDMVYIDGVIYGLGIETVLFPHVDVFIGKQFTCRDVLDGTTRVSIFGSIVQIK